MGGGQREYCDPELSAGGWLRGWGVRAMREQWQRAKEWEQFNTVYGEQGEARKCVVNFT